MNLTVQKILIVTTDVNAILARRMRGHGFAVGIDVQFFTNMDEIPKNDISSKILVIHDTGPGDLAAITQERWKKIYVISNSQTMPPPGCQGVYVNKLAEPALTWPIILDGIIENLHPTNRELSWHAVIDSQNVLSPELSNALKKWASIRKIAAYSSVRNLLNFLQNIELDSTPQNVHFDAAVDASSIQLILHFPTFSSTLSQKIQSYAQTSNSSYSSIRKINDELIWVFRFDFSKIDSPQVLVVDTATESLEDKNQSLQVAS